MLRYDNNSLDFFRGDCKYYVNAARKPLMKELSFRSFEGPKSQLYNLRAGDLLKGIFELSLKHRTDLSIYGYCCPASYLTFIAKKSETTKYKGFCEYLDMLFLKRGYLALLERLFDALLYIEHYGIEEDCDLPRIKDNQLIGYVEQHNVEKLYDFWVEQHLGRKESAELGLKDSVRFSYPMEALDAMKECNSGVYLLYNSNKKLKYIGKSINLLSRVVSSARERNAYYFRLIQSENKADVHIIEPYLVGLLRPPLNGEFNDNSDRPSFELPIELNYSKYFKIVRQKLD